MKLESLVATISQKALAEHWGVSAPRVTQLKANYHGGKPFDFTSFDQADAWRARNCPPQPDRADQARRAQAHRRPSGAKVNPPAASSVADPALPLEPKPVKQPQVLNSPQNLPALNVASSSVVHGKAVEGESPNEKPRGVESFEEKMLRRAEETIDAAQKLYEMAVASCEHAQVAQALRNLNEATKNATSARERFLAIQTAARNLVSLDEVQDVVGPLLQELRRYLERQGGLLCLSLTGKPAEDIRAAIDTANDAQLRALEAMSQRMASELKTPVEESETEEAA